VYQVQELQLLLQLLVVRVVKVINDSQLKLLEVQAALEAVVVKETVIIMETLPSDKEVQEQLAKEIMVVRL
jgi:hypothetical protein